MTPTMRLTPIMLALMGTALLIPSTSWSEGSREEAGERPRSQPGLTTSTPEHQMRTLAGDDGDPPEQKPSTASRPAYKPPKPGRPWRTIGGATRSVGDPLPDVAVLAPNDHSGRTLSEQPTLYFYLSSRPAIPIEFTLLDEEGVSPLVETELRPHADGGIQPVRLTDYGVALEPGKRYQWYIALVQDREHRSKDVVAEAGIERVAPQAELTSRLREATGVESALVYAEAGLWYDALAALSDLIAASPTDEELLALRRALLEQVQLDHAVPSQARAGTSNAG